MRAFQQGAPDKPTVPPLAVLKLRVHTLAEEVCELASASGLNLDVSMRNGDIMGIGIEETDMKPNLLEMADALADIQYFVDGSAIAYGLDLEPFFDVVHAANMGKLWTVQQLASLPPGYTATLSGGVSGAGADPLFIVRRQDGKIMKPPGFKAPDLSGVLDAQMSTT